MELFWANLKQQFRDRQRLFWSFMFPLIFTVIFGFFFGDGSVNAGTVAVVNHAETESLKQIMMAMEGAKLFKVEKETDLGAARDRLKNNKVTAVIEIPLGFGSRNPNASRQLKVIYDPANAQSNSVVLGFLNQYLNNMNFKALLAEPVFSLTEEKTSSRSLTYFDFVLIGLLGMALMNSSIQGVAISMAKYREDKILKRITTTPLPAWKFVAAEVASRLIINILQISLILAIGVYAFHGHLYGNLWLVYLLSLIGAVLFQLIGFVIAGLTKTTSAAEGMATAIAIPMMFLAGVFFPIDQLPRWLYSIVQYLPLAPLLRLIRSVALESGSVLDKPFDVSLIFIWVVALLMFAVWRFRLVEE